MALAVGNADYQPISGVTSGSTSTLSPVVATLSPAPLVGVGNYDGTQYVDFTGGGGQVQGDSTYADQQAAYAAAAAEAQRKAEADAAFRSAKQIEENTLYDTSRNAANNWSTGYNSRITDYLEDSRVGQQGIDLAGAKNIQARNQGQAGILGMVGRGIQSSGMMLGNRNAGSSSAVMGLANAYGQMGQRQMANVGNQYKMGEMDVQQQQSVFDNSRNRGMRKLGDEKNDFINNVISSAQEKLAQLNADYAGASLPDRIAIEQRIADLKGQVSSVFQQYDQRLAAENAQIKASSYDQRAAKANQLRDAGTSLGQDAFNFTDQSPMQWQGQAPAGSNLPIWTNPRRKVV